MAEENPYQQIVGMMKEEAKKTQRRWLRVGEVVKTAPLTIRIAGTEQSGGSLFLNEQIQNGHKEKIMLVSGLGSVVGLMNGMDTVSLKVDRENEDPSHVIRVEGENQLQECLKIGDKVLTLSEDDQVFFVLCKVVRA